MNLGINNQNSPAFSARLDIKAAEKMISPDEIAKLTAQVQKIGTDNDIINVSIGEQRRWGVGDNRAGTVLEGYPMQMDAFLNGKLVKNNLDETIDVFQKDKPTTPFDKLTSFFNKLEKAMTTDFSKELETKISALKSRIDAAKQTIDEQWKISREADDKRWKTEEELSTLQKELEQLMAEKINY